MAEFVVIGLIFVVLVIVIAFIVFYGRKPKTELENYQKNLEKAAKIIKKNREKSEKERQKFESVTKDFLRKNNEKLKEMQKNSI